MIIALEKQLQKEPQGLLASQSSYTGKLPIERQSLSQEIVQNMKLSE